MTEPRTAPASTTFTLIVLLATAATAQTPVVDTGQTSCYDNTGKTSCPGSGQALFGQDAQHDGAQPAYRDNGDGTVTDRVTGLLWQQGFAPEKLTYDQALDYVDGVNAQRFAGYDDWRLPTIKQLYSLMDYRGTDPAPDAWGTAGLIPFINTDVFDFAYGDLSAGERIIDSQWATSSLYTADENLMFGVNFADGRIKGYGRTNPDPRRGEKTFYVRLCRGNPEYGTNDFVDHGNGTVTDEATGLMWSRDDSGEGMKWEDALAWAQEKNAEGYLGYSDWRLPNAKELHSILDYSRSPDTTRSAAIDPVFRSSGITNEYGQKDYPFYWTSTSFVRSNGSASAAVYMAFGRGLGYMNGRFVDIHGAGCQRSDPKDGDPDDFPRWGYGPQGDIQRVFNHVRLVRTPDTSLQGCIELGGEGLEGAAVALLKPRNKKLKTATGDDGCFQLSPLDAGEKLTLRISGPALESQQDVLAACFALGQEPLADARLVLKQPGQNSQKSWTDDAGCGFFETLELAQGFKLTVKTS